MKEIIVRSDDIDAIHDLQLWFSRDFSVVDVESDKLSSLGENGFAFKIVFEFVKENWEKLVLIVKNWMSNYNKDFEFTFESGEKKINIRCPSKRVNDDNLDQIFSSLENLLKGE